MFSTPEVFLKNSKKSFSKNDFAKAAEKKVYRPVVFAGKKQKMIRMLIWVNIILISLKTFRNPFEAIKQIKNLLQLRNKFHNGYSLNKYVQIRSRFFYNYNAPGWPSKSFNKYVTHQLRNIAKGNENNSIHTLLFAITKKCGFKCEHCFEWDNLNKKEVLTRKNLMQIVHSFQDSGVSQIQLSGGEPLNRLDDIIFLLDHAYKGTDFWILTSGYNLTKDKALLLKQHGLTGITISVDHCEEQLHDQFRGVAGSFKRAFNAVEYARNAGLVVCFSICPTRKFISKENLYKYALLAKEAGVSFIQIMEPKATGHYANQPVTLHSNELKELEDFYEQLNFCNNNFNEYPIISYHGYYTRRIGCAGGGKDYLYVDTDGYIQSCPFCQSKLFSALDSNLQKNLSILKQTGCALPGVKNKKENYETV